MPLNKDHVDMLIALGKHDIVRHVAPPVDCEICGHPMPTHADALNLALAIQVGVPGHPAIAVIQCPLPEHWTCSTDCWLKMVDTCAKEHMLPLIQHAHERVGRPAQPQKRIDNGSTV